MDVHGETRPGAPCASAGRGSPEAASWLARARERLAAEPSALAELHAGARRALEDTPPPDDASWTRAAAARACLLADAIARAPGSALALARQLYRESDEAAQVDLVRGLPVLPGGDALKPLALEAGRTNSRAVFAALALDNPYPARHYAEPEFNQLVLKALFLELPVERLVGLRERANAELARMCEDYVDEREAAGRAVPADIWLALAPQASPRGEAMLRRYARSNAPEHRRYAREALARRGGAD